MESSDEDESSDDMKENIELTAVTKRLVEDTVGVLQKGQGARMQTTHSPNEEVVYIYNNPSYKPK